MVSNFFNSSRQWCWRF